MLCLQVCRIVLNIRQTAEEDKRNALLQVSASDNRTGLFPLTKPQNRGNAGSVEPQIPGAPSFRMNLYSSRDVDQQDSLEKGRQVPFDSNDDDGRDVEVRDDKPAVEDQFKKGYAL